MRAMHHKFPAMPVYIAGKEISLEDVRLALRRMADRFFEPPATASLRARWRWRETLRSGLRSREPRKRTRRLQNEFDIVGRNLGESPRPNSTGWRMSAVAFEPQFAARGFRRVLSAFRRPNPLCDVRVTPRL